MFTRKLRKNNKTYIITYDEDRVLNTVQLDGKYLKSTNAAVKIINNNSRAIFNGGAPNGFQRV